MDTNNDHTTDDPLWIPYTTFWNEHGSVYPFTSIYHNCGVIGICWAIVSDTTVILENDEKILHVKRYALYYVIPPLIMNFCSYQDIYHNSDESRLANWWISFLYC